LLYPYLKACPRCAAAGQVVRVESHKPGSDTIGRIAAKTLSVMLSVLSPQAGEVWQVRQTSRQIFDIDLLLFSRDLLALGEVKASPLIAFPLISPLERELRRRGEEGEQRRIVRHRRTDLPLDKAGKVALYLPHVGKQFSLGKPTSRDYPVRQFRRLYAGNPQVVLDIL